MTRPSGAAKVAAIKKKQDAAKRKKQPAVLPPHQEPDTTITKEDVKAIAKPRSFGREAKPKVEKRGVCYHLEARNQGDELVCYVKFDQAWEAQRWLEIIADGSDIKILPDESVTIKQYIFRSPNRAKYGAAADALATMREIVEYKQTKLEREHPFPYSDHEVIARAMAGLPSRLQQHRDQLAAQVAADAGKTASAATAKAAPKQKEASGPRRLGAWSTGSDPYAIKPDMPWDQKVRRMAKKLCVEKNGSEDGWRTMKGVAEKRVKEAGL